MVKFERRDHNRKPCDLPILFFMEESKDFQNARLFNVSVNGMSFESHTFIAPGTKVQIKLDSHALLRNALKDVIAADKLYQAVVRWCSKIKDDEEPNYLVGVMLTESLTLQ